MRRGRRWAPLALSLVLLLALGGFGLWLVRASTAAAEAALGEGAVGKQRTVATLTDQYLLIAAKEILDFAAAQPFELTQDSAADAALLEPFIQDRSEFFDHGAVLADLVGRRLTVVGDVPPGDDPGYGPLRSALVRGEPGVSSVMDVDGHPVVAIGVPVLRAGEPAAIMLAYFRAADSHLQRYSGKLGAGSDAVGMVVDSDGTIVAARHAELVGTALADSPARAARADGRAGHERFVRDGAEMVVTWAPIATGGWSLVEEEPAAGFYASARGQSHTAQLALLGLLLAGAVSATVLNHRTDRARRRGEARCEALVRDASDVVTIVDGDGTVTYASPAMRRVLGFDPADVVGRRGIELVHPDDVVKVQAAVTAAAGTEDHRQRLQARILRADGGYSTCEVVVSDQHADPSVHGTVVSIRDISELVALHDELAHQAMHDPLTELPNRTQLELRMGEAIATCDDERRVAALFVDLDGFKAVNDRLGHDRGDELLVQVAERLQRCVREGDTVARLGGDEFVIVLADAAPEANAARIATRALDLLSEPLQAGDELVTVGASIGIALGGVDSEPETLLREADAAMYLAKERGRFRFEFPSAGLAGTGTTVVATAPADASDLDLPQTEVQPPSTASV